MTAIAARPPPTGLTLARRPGVVVARQAFRQVRIGAVVLALAFGGSAYATATAYASTYPTQEARRQAAALVSGDAGLRILLGPIQDIATVGGYLVYKNFVFLTLVGGIWAALAATRLLRGEEDLGRRQLVLAGAVSASQAATAALAALMAAVLTVFAGATALTLLAARDPSFRLGSAATVLYGVSLSAVPLVFATVGAVTSQLGRTRRVATSLALLVLTASFVLRMIADTGPGTRWLLWLTPFGWTELVRPYTANDVRPMLVAGVAALLLAGVAVRLAARRDVGAGLIASHDTRPPRLLGLGSPLGLALRLEAPALAAWCVGAAAAGLAFGVFAELTRSRPPDSLGNALDRYGTHGSFTDQFLGVVFLLIATVVALLPAGQVAASAAEETSGRLVHLLTRPVRRAAWLAERLLLTATTIVAAALLGGLGTWAGGRSQGLELRLGALLGAGLNVVPTALVALGVGAIVLSLAPRIAGGAVYTLVIWSVFVDLVGPLVSTDGQLVRLSLFHYMALLPGGTVDWRTVSVTTAIGLALCAAGTALFGRQDLRSA